MPVTGGMKAGIISKPYGLQGMVQLIVEPEAKGFIHAGEPLFIHIDGQRIPFFVEDMEEVSDDLLRIKFEFVDDLDQAGGICGNSVFLDSRIIPAERAGGDLYSGLTGYMAFNQDAGLLGRITGVVGHEQNPLLRIVGQGKELLVPAAVEFILQIDPDNRTVRIELPDGLTSL